MQPFFLVVDDLEENRSFLSRIIRYHFHEAIIQTASSGIEALEAVKGCTPDLILLDALMPKLDGFETCRRLKANPITTSIPILMVSAILTDTENRISGLDSGADSYICKPFENDELLAQVNALLRIRRNELELREQKRRLEAELATRQRIEQELLEARRIAEDATRAKGEFLANMSHELRTPMNGVIGLTDVLLDSELTAAQRDLATTIKTSGETLLAVINDILDFSKIESGKMELEDRVFPLRNVITHSFDMLQRQADRKGLKLTWKIAPHTPAEVAGDEMRLRQILANLLSNAVKFTEHGGIDLQVAFAQLDQHAGELQFAVKDSGIGIPSEKTNRLFQSFSQVDASTTRQYGGTGLGLAISKHLAELMGGKMWLESEVGRGSTFYFTVRIRLPRSGENSSTHALRDRRVLVLDPDTDTRERLTAMLTSWDMAPMVGTAMLTDLNAVLRQQPPPEAILINEQLLEAAPQSRIDALRHWQAETGAPIVLIRPETATTPLAHNLPLPVAAQVIRPISASNLFAILARALSLDGAQADTETSAALSPMQAQHPLRILLAEDNRVNQKVASHMLERMGYTATVAANGAEVLTALQQQVFDVVLMDLQMPVMDGLEATRRIRAEWPAAQQPHIVALTASAMQDDRDRCLAAGMNDYVRKPIRERDLRAALQRCPQVAAK